MNVIPASLKGV